MIFVLKKNPCRENLYLAKREQFMCVKNPCFTVEEVAINHMSMRLYESLMLTIDF